MAPQYKLTYFNARGKAELARWIFKVAQVEFEDFRIPKGGWVDIKPGTPFGQVPTLEIDGKIYAQSHAIYRYLAHQFGMAGEGSTQHAMVDMILDCCNDLGAPVNKIYTETNTPEKEEMFRKYHEEQLPAFLTLFEKLLKQNNGGQRWFVGDKMSLADLSFVLYTSSWLETINVTPQWADFPLLSALKDRVLALPQLQQWFSERPTTSF